MSVLQWLALQLRGWFVWLVQPYILIIILISLTLGAVTWYVLHDPIFGLVIKPFVTHTLPQWGRVAAAFIARTTAWRWLWRGILFFLNLFAFRWLREMWAQTKTHLEHRKERTKGWWQQQTLRTKTFLVTGTICLLWLPLGWGVLYFVPLVMVGEAAGRAVRWLVNRLWLSHLLERIEGWCAECMPKPLRERHSKFVKSVDERIRNTRRKIAAHHRVKKLEQRAKEKFEKLAERFKQEEQL